CALHHGSPGRTHRQSVVSSRWRDGRAGRRQEMSHGHLDMKRYAELLAETKARIKEISVKDLLALRHTTGDIVIVDVREQHEYNLGTIPGALTIGRSNLEKNVEAQVPREKTVILFCASGNRSAFAADQLV